MTDDENSNLGKIISNVLGKSDPERLLEFLDKADKLIIDIQNSFREAIINFFTRNIIYKTTIQSGRRISIPPEEMNSAGIKEGDLVQVIIIPLKHINENKKSEGGVNDGKRE
jgi:hypothetical protein